MKQEISSLDLHFLVKEFKILETGRVQKIYQWEKKDFIFVIYTKEGKKNLRVSLPSLLFFTEKRFEAPTKPPGYCEFLRKYLIGATVVKVEQKGFERILQIEFESSKHGHMTLIIELFKPGNMILIKDKIVLSPLERQKFKDRNIQAKGEYVYPPEQFDTKNASAKEIMDILSKSSKSIVKELAIDLGFGGVYAEEILVRAGIQKDAKEPKPIKEIKQMFEDKISPFTIQNEVFPIKMKSKDKEEMFESFNKAIDSIIPKIVFQEKKEDKVKKQDIIIETQRKRLKELEKELKETQEIGEYIYEHYSEFETLLNKITELKKTKSYKEIKIILKENKHFKEMNEKEKKIVLEF